MDMLETCPNIFKIIEYSIGLTGKKAQKNASTEAEKHVLWLCVADNWQITFGLADNHPAIYSAQPQFEDILNRQFCFIHTVLYYIIFS